MNSEFISKLETIDWKAFADTMHEKGYGIIPKMLTDSQCEELKNDYENPLP